MIVLTGGGLASARAAETLRAEGYHGPLTLVGGGLLGLELAASNGDGSCNGGPVGASARLRAGPTHRGPAVEEHIARALRPSRPQRTP